MLGNILILDDDRDVLESLELLLRSEARKVSTMSDPRQLSSFLKPGMFDVVLLDMNFASGRTTGNEGIFWLKEILEADPDLSVIMITAFGDVELAVKSITYGAVDFIQKPWSSEKLISTLNSAGQLCISKRKVKQLESKKQVLQDEAVKKYPEIIGQSPAVQHLHRAISKVAKTDTTVLVLGENGTGKELIAWEIHRQSKRFNQLFVTVDLGALSETLFESELFGHKRGAFTDAGEDRTGRIEAAHGGTLFLDEIGNLPLHLQSKLLSVLQNRVVIPVGSNTPVPVDVRIISATNTDLGQLVTAGHFRQDLFYRINTVQIHTPPVREREQDIGILAEHFINLYSKKYNKPRIRLSKKALQKLNRYRWPGNVRELQHAMENVVIMCESDVIQPENFHFATSEPEEESSLRLDLVEKKTIQKALLKYAGNYSQIAAELGISRTTLYHKIKRYGL